MTLPAPFEQQAQATLGQQRYGLLLNAMGEEPPVSIRLNSGLTTTNIAATWGAQRVPWCNSGAYLNGRPSFTFDPLLHAGAYYVQEAGSMFLWHVLRQLFTGTLTDSFRGDEPIDMLDLCAAPGGKSTCAAQSLPQGSTLTVNEPMGKRVQVLSENIQKWWTFGGSNMPQVSVTNSYARDFAKAGATFDIVLADVPCSGEGMFRKDEGAIADWSTAKVEQCRQLQRSIVADIWKCLKPGGVLIYSTCTLNTMENEENTRWIAEELGADILTVPTEPGWNITGSLLEGFTAPVYRFIPGITRSEGLFMAVMRKHGSRRPTKRKGSVKPLPLSHLTALHDAADAPLAQLSYQQAVAYLRREALTLSPDMPRGLVRVSYNGAILGLAKNVGNHANNLYPKEWRIKSTHIPEETNVIDII